MRELGLAVYTVACLLANMWPGYGWLGNSIEPRILGLPFSLAWVVGWVLATFVVVAIYHATGPEESA